MAEEWQAEERLKKYLESKIDTSLQLIACER